MKAINDVTNFIIGEQRSGSDRRVKLSSRKELVEIQSVEWTNV